jgi:hypothetical protein
MVAFPVVISDSATARRRDACPMCAGLPFRRLDRNMGMPDLFAEMQQCKTVKACIALALTDAYGDYKQASAWLTCIETMFGRFDRVKLMGEEAILHGFDLVNEMAGVAICGKAKRRARVALESIASCACARIWSSCRMMSSRVVISPPSRRAVAWRRHSASRCPRQPAREWPATRRGPRDRRESARAIPHRSDATSMPAPAVVAWP